MGIFVSTKGPQIHLKVLTFIKVKTFSFEIWLFVDDPATVEDTEATRFLLDVEALEVGKLVHQGDRVAGEDLVVGRLLLAPHHLRAVDAPERSLGHHRLLPRLYVGFRFHLEPVGAHRVVLADAGAIPKISVCTHRPDDPIAAGDPHHHPVHLRRNDET